MVMASDYKRAINNYLIPFFGNHYVATIDNPLIAQFADWRREKMKREPAMSTVRMHAAALRKIFDEAVAFGYMSEAQVPSLKVRKKQGRATERRPTFTIEEYRELYRFMRSWIRKGRPGKSTDMRELLRDYVLLLANSGIRHGTEALSMRWSGIRELKDGEQRGLMIWVKEGKTKPGWAVLRHGARRYLERIKERTEALKDLTWEQALKQDLPIIALPDGTVTKNLNQTFAKLMKDSGLTTDPITKKRRTLYSLRHFYITQAILANRTSPLKLAGQCRTSVLMLEKHYFHLKQVQHWKELAQ